MDFNQEAIAFTPPIPENSLQAFQEHARTEEIRQHALKVGIEAAKTEVQHKFNNPDKPETNKPYHNDRHIEAGIERGKLALLALDATPEDSALFEFAFTFHDLDQIKPGASEHSSAKRAAKYLSEINRVHHQQVFTIPDVRNVFNAIIMTHPQFNPELRTIYQPNLRFAQSKIEVAVAFADLAGLGLPNSEQTALQDGANLFLEIFKEEPTGNKTETTYLEDALKWFTTNQPAFVEGRKTAYRQEIASLPDSFEPYKQKLLNLCDEQNFDRAARIIKMKAELMQHKVSETEHESDPRARRQQLLELAKITDPGRIIELHQKLQQKQAA